MAVGSYLLWVHIVNQRLYEGTLLDAAHVKAIHIIPEVNLFLPAFNTLCYTRREHALVDIQLCQVHSLSKRVVLTSCLQAPQGQQMANGYVRCCNDAVEPVFDTAAN